MDHAEVIEQKIAEKYVLGDLSAEVREQFEEHYFDCAECTSDLEALASLLTVGKVVAQEGLSSKPPAPDKTAERRGWFAWLRPITVVSAMAALLGVFVLQNAGLIPVLKRPSANRPFVQVYESTYRLQGVTRGGSASKLSVNPHESFALDFDFTPTESAPSYRGALLDASGTAVFAFTLDGTEANKELHLVVPADTVHAGDYDLVFTDESGASDAKNKEVQRLSFSIEFRP
jgi:Putative zinc-finger